MPFTCEVCGRRSAFPDLIPPVGDVLRCPHCADERPFVRPPLLVVTGTAGIGKSTLCARLAGTIPGAVLLDADVLAADLVSVASPNRDYPAFWRSMMRLAHELAQNNVVVVYFAVMLPDQVLANSDVLSYFDTVNFLCLTCRPDVVRARLAGREPGADIARIEVWVDFNGALVAAASEIPTATVLDAGRAIDQVDHDVRHWIHTQLRRRGALRTDSTTSASAHRTDRRPEPGTSMRHTKHGRLPSVCGSVPRLVDDRRIAGLRIRPFHDDYACSRARRSS